MAVALLGRDGGERATVPAVDAVAAIGETLLHVPAGKNIEITRYLIL